MNSEQATRKAMDMVPDMVMEAIQARGIVFVVATLVPVEVQTRDIVMVSEMTLDGVIALVMGMAPVMQVRRIK